MSFEVVITDAGRAEIINAENTGTGPVEITQIGFGYGQYLPASSQTALQNETKRISTISGEVVAADTIHVIVQDETQDEYDVGEFGLFTGSGTLLAVYSQPSAQGWIIEKSPASTLLLAVDIILATIDATSLTFGDASFLNPPATESTPGVILRASESKALDGTDDLAAMTPLRVRQAYGQYGLGVSVENPVTDLNNLTTTGFYRFSNGPTNRPGTIGGSDFFDVLVTGGPSSRYTQVAFWYTADGTLQMYFRNNTTGTWQGWRIVFHSGIVATQAEAEAGSNNIAPMTPLSTHQAFNRFGLGSEKGLQFSGNDLNNATVSGFYDAVSGDANAPAGASVNASPVLTMMARGGDNGGQIFLDRTSGAVWVRAVLNTWGAWRKLLQDVDIATENVAEAGTDNTKVMTPLRVRQAFGQFGLGASSSRILDLDDSDISPGTYYFMSAGVSGTLPPGLASLGGIIRVSTDQNYDVSVQEIFSYESNSVRAWSRRFIAGTSSWAPWQEVFTSERVASQSQAEAGTSNDTIMTPLRVAQAIAAQALARSEFTGTRATNGYQRIPGSGVADLIIQWGTVTSFGSDNQSVTFPISFPNACLNITTGMKSNQILNANVGAHSYSTTGFTILNDGRYHTAWLAIGY